MVAHKRYNVTSSNASETTMLQSGNVEIEKEIDIDKEKEIEKEKEGEKEIDIDSCVKQDSTPQAFIKLPLNTGELWSVTTKYIEELKRLIIVCQCVPHSQFGNMLDRRNKSKRNVLEFLGKLKIELTKFCY